MAENDSNWRTKGLEKRELAGKENGESRCCKVRKLLQRCNDVGKEERPDW